MANLFNRAGMATATAGTGTITLGSALGAVAPNVCSFMSFAGAGVTDQAIVSYLILDANGAWEIGTGTYTASGTTLTRNVKLSSNANTTISLTGNAQVFVAALAADGGDILGGAANPLRGTDTPVNLQLNASNNGTKLTIAIKGNNGSDPSPTNPVLIPFRDPTLANGGPKWAAVTAALSIDTNAAGATFGTVGGKPFRIWIVAFYNSGAPVLAFYQSMTGNFANSIGVAPLSPVNVASSTAVSGSATSAATFYTPNGTTVANDAFCILGYAEYASGLGTAGLYNSNPTKVQLFGPGGKRPGDVVQTVMFTKSSAVSNSSSVSLIDTNLTATITPSSTVNPVLARAVLQEVYNGTAVSPAYIVLALMRGASQIGGCLSGYTNTGSPSGTLNSEVMEVCDLPATTSATTYKTQFRAGVTGMTATVENNGGTASITLMELMS